MPEAEPITFFPLLREPWIPCYYSMYHPELQLILSMSFSTTTLEIPWRQGASLVFLITDSSAPSADLVHIRNKKNISWTKEMNNEVKIWTN